jgi:hypothetical protein
MKNTKIVTGIVRLSYVNLWEPRSFNGGKEKYSVSIIIPKSDKKTISDIKTAINNAIENAKDTKFGGQIPALGNLKNPLRDGDEQKSDDPAYVNSLFINASTEIAPKIVDETCNLILDRSEIYSGVYARVSLNFFAFNFAGSKGVSCCLGNVQKKADGEPLGSVFNAFKEFSELNKLEEVRG